MKRLIYRELVAWKQSGCKKPLMLIGARQVGKTWIVKSFLESEFGNYIYFNLFDDADLREVFAEQINTKEKIAKLELIVGRKIDFERTVIFFDEIQESEELIEALKYFSESDVPYKIICAGSLLGVKLKRMKSSFPVGKVKLLEMYALDFEEFLDAMDESLISEEIYHCYACNTPLSEPFHRKAMELYKKYLCVGGMPEAVEQFANSGGDILSFDRSILADICSGYVSDMSKHVGSPIEMSRIESVYRSIPAQLGNMSGKFQYAKVRHGARAREYDTALSWLIASHMVYRCDLVSRPELPLMGYLRDGFFKLYLNDTGILCSLLDIRFPDVMLEKDISYKGIITESYIAGQLKARGLPLHYWQSGNKAEIDFLLESPDGVMPVEAKAGRNVRSPSLEVYRGIYNPIKSLRISARNFGAAGGIISVPLYAVWCVAKSLGVTGSFHTAHRR